MANVHVEIKNLPEIRAAFKRSPELMTKNLNSAIKKVTNNLVSVAASTTPHATGYLKRTNEIKFDNLKGSFEKKAEYAYFVHEGTKFMSARPFLTDAIQIAQGFTDAEFDLAVEKTLNEIAR